MNTRGGLLYVYVCTYFAEHKNIIRTCNQEYVSMYVCVIPQNTLEGIGMNTCGRVILLSCETFQHSFLHTQLLGFQLVPITNRQIVASQLA